VRGAVAWQGRSSLSPTRERGLPSLAAPRDDGELDRLRRPSRGRAALRPTDDCRPFALTSHRSRGWSGRRGVRRVQVRMGAGNDHVHLSGMPEEMAPAGAPPSATPSLPLPGSVKVNMGRDADELIVCDWQSAGLVRLDTGKGTDTVVIHDSLFQNEHAPDASLGDGGPESESGALPSACPSGGKGVRIAERYACRLQRTRAFPRGFVDKWTLSSLLMAFPGTGNKGVFSTAVRRLATACCTCRFVSEALASHSRRSTPMVS